MSEPTSDRGGQRRQGGPRRGSGPDRGGGDRPRSGAGGGKSRRSGEGSGRSSSKAPGGKASRPGGSSAAGSRSYGRSSEGERSGPGRSGGRPYSKSVAGERAGSTRKGPGGSTSRPGGSSAAGTRSYGKSSEGERPGPSRSGTRSYGKSSEGERSGPSRSGGESGRGRQAARSGDRSRNEGRSERSSARSGGRTNAAGDRARGSRQGTADTRGRGYASERPGRATEGERRERRDAEREYAPRPGLAAKPNEPPTPKGLDLRQLPRGVRAELRGLTAELAEVVGAHLLMAGQLIDTDPELAHAHAEAARRRAARLPITREAAAETAYAAGDYATALTEFRALRRMSGGDEYLPAMADCERALGRPQAALKLIKDALATDPDVSARVELRLVEAGVRADTGQVAEALRLLKAEIEETGTRGSKVTRARLRYAYADLLERTGESGQAERWFDAVVRLDPDQTTDAVDRVAALRGLVIDFDDSEDEDDQDGEDGEPETQE